MAAGQHAQRLEILDLARGLGFLLVLFRHCIGFLGGSVLTQIMPQDATILDFFFLLSGFFAGYANEEKLRRGQKTVTQVIFERIVRVYPMILLGTLVGALVSIPSTAYHLSAVDIPMALTAIVKGCLLIPAHIRALNLPGPLALFPLDVPLWFLFFDCLAYLLFVFVLRTLTLAQLSTITGFALLGLWGGAVAYHSVNFGPAWVDMPWAIPRVLFGFTFGYILFRIRRHFQITLGPAHAALPLLVLAAVIFVPVPASFRYSGELQAFTATAIMPLVVLFAANAQAGPRLSSISRIASRIALPVYALHFPIVWALSTLRWSLHLHGIAGLVLLAIEFVSSLIVAFFATLYVDEPIRKFLLESAALHIFKQSMSSSNRKAVI